MNESLPYLIIPYCPICLIHAGKSHLRGKPYHISALYVVDLEKFRKDRVGDILRSQYHALSADPGSLANLDQDLPNYVQHQVPIFSLPQEWLWCESWCSNETKAASKTIDLCNNPLHKEPKVSMAKVRTTLIQPKFEKPIYLAPTCSYESQSSCVLQFPNESSLYYY
jgi:hypothetical protein